ncbi:Rieske (2Fe-2S) protein [Terracoccus sp. 273MFTsu3.1]|uniref:Rieske (2Fe-2S) protein n=1 Tax=Terracoccus sp. 273MFTsu3.1 TaxID=1172188 RepID=UPI0003671418|nr:Rieske (2Fe-2S) protein [Terracoccus sp. 273MFTsu3.1]
MTERTHSSTTEPTSSTSTSDTPPTTPSALPSTGPAEPGLGDRISVLTDRRGVLRVAGVVVGAGALAACSSPPVPTAPADPSSSGAAVTPSSGAAAAGGTPTSEIPVGGGKIFADTKTVVTQPAAGTFKAFDAVCPHQGCTVSSVEGGQIICPCHQSHFDATTGDRVSGPAPTGLTAKTITVTGDTFTVS